MGRRRRLKAAEISLPGKPKIYDLRPAGKKEEDYMDVECPLNGEIIRLPVEKRDPLIWAFRRNLIDAPQKDVGELWRKCRQTSQFGLGAIDYSKVRVDGGKIYDPLSDSQIKATKWLTMIDQELDSLGRKINEPMKSIMKMFLGERYFPKRIAEMYGRSGERWSNHYMIRCKDGLQAMAVVAVSFPIRS